MVYKQLPLVHAHKEVELNFWLDLEGLCSLPGHGDIKEWLHRGMLPLEPRGAPGCPAHSRDGAGQCQHLLLSCQLHFTPCPTAGSAGDKGQGWGRAGEALGLGQGWGCVRATAAAATSSEAPARPRALATGSAH